MGDECDAACMKIIIDTGMGVFAAGLYGRTLERNTASFAPVDYEAPQFYIDAALKFGEIAQNLSDGNLSKAQRDSLMEQIDKQCYRADYMITWSRVPAPSAEVVNAWTNNLFLWTKEDQEFYTALAKEAG